MVGQEPKIGETMAAPDVVIDSRHDPSVRLYHRLYEQTPVTRKYVLVAVKVLDDDAFVVTAFFTDRQKQGSILLLRMLPTRLLMLRYESILRGDEKMLREG